VILRKDVKVPGGKLLRIELELCDGVAHRVSVRGDFFAHPEEEFEEAEVSLSGLSARELPMAARSAFGRPSLRIFGASGEDIALAIEETLHEAQAD
jgi:lipoate---protein ligase